MADVIDAFAHVLPKGFFDEMVEVHPTDELKALSDAPRFWDMGIRLESMDEYGIDKQVVSLARPPIWSGIDPEDSVEMVRLANDGVREIADDHPDRFIPVATLPVVNDDLIDEFDRCIDDLGMAGVQLYSNVSGRPIDSEEVRPLFARAASKGVPIWLHPQLHEWHEWDHEYMLHKILGWPFDTSLAMARLVFGGILDEHPDLAVIPHHMGGMIPHFVDRLDLFHRMLVEHRDVYPYPVRELDGPIEEYFSRFYADTCRSGAPSVLEDGVEFFGEDRLVFATDYPFGPDEGRAFMRAEVEALRSMDVSDAVRSRVSGGNIEALLS